MKKLATLVLVSILGGAITLGTYKIFLEKEQTVTQTEALTKPVLQPVNYSTNNTNLSSIKNVDFTAAAEKTIHAVVHIKSITTTNQQLTMRDLFMGRVPQRRQLGTGSGVIISPDGYIITNNHVIDGSQKLSVTLNDNRTLEATIVGTDAKTDIALLKIESDNNLPYATFGDSDTSKIGEWVLAVGNPFNLTSTVTAGIISAKSRDLAGEFSQSFIQTDAAVNPGNSGGALVNTNGELIGINTAISSQTGSYIGYSFAVPSNIARKVIEDIMEFGDVQKGVLGIIPRALNSFTAEKLGVTETEGIYIEEVEQDTGAALAGIKSGDIIKKIDNVTINKFSDLRGYLDTKSPNDKLTIYFIRDNKQKETVVTLLKNNSITVNLIGILKEAKVKDLKRFKAKNGLLLKRLTSNTNYANYWRNNGVGEGDLIISINNIKVNTVEDVKNIMTNLKTNQLFTIKVMREEGEIERHSFR